MKASKVLWVIMAAAMVTVGLSGISYAFHDGGVASCDSCHTMHNASGTTGVMGGRAASAGYSYKGSTAQFQGNAFLLQGTDQSSTCLNCHAVAENPGASYHIMSPDAATNGYATHHSPGGDFGWLLVSPVSAGSTYDKSRRGHNINAADFGLGTSAPYAITLQTAPGGTYPQSALHCSSCHDPHGTYRHSTGDPTQSGDIVSSVFTTGFTGSTTSSISGSGSYGVKGLANSAVGVYRLLAGKGYQPLSLNGAAPSFANNSPIAIAPSTYDIVASTFGITGGAAGTSEVVVQYGSGMSEWCANCHGPINGGMSTLIHPASSTDGSAKLSNTTAGSSIVTNYNSYVYSGNLTGVNLYAPLVPVEIGTLTPLAAAAKNGTAPTVTGSANVSCLSCHRAHASAWQNMTRFDVNGYEMMTVGGNYAGVDNPGGAPRGAVYNMSQYKYAMEGRPANVFAVNQRSLCNKCHAKD